MAAPLDADWSNITITDASLNKVTHGSGTSFPANWPITTRLFWRSDLERMYYNKGADTTPTASDWEGVGVPTGTVMAFVGDEADVPSGWLLCDGSTVSQTTYDVLYDRIGSKYGSDAGGNFTLPDMQTGNSFPRGATNDAGLGGSGGSRTITTSNMPAHTHNIKRYSGGTGNNTYTAASLSTAVTDAVTESTGSGTDYNPPYVDFHYIIAV